VRRSVDAACASIGRMTAPAYEVAYMSTAIGLVRAGLGATLLPSSAAELRATGDLVVRDLAAPRIERELGALKLRRRAYSPAAEALVAVLAAATRLGIGVRERAVRPRRA
jgi:DNA-binding transcriptional LysR family regulator